MRTLRASASSLLGRRASVGSSAAPRRADGDERCEQEVMRQQSSMHSGAPVVRRLSSQNMYHSVTSLESRASTMSRPTRWQRFNRWASSAMSNGRISANVDFFEDITQYGWRPTLVYATDLGQDQSWRGLVLKHMQPKASNFALHPHQSSMRNWNCLVLLLLVVEAPLLPVQLAFVSDERLLQLPWLLWFRLWIELVFWLDMVVQFFVRIQPDDRTYWISDVRQIAWNYIRGRFIIDLFSVLPVRGLVASLMGVPSDQCSIAAVGFLRLLRFARWPTLINTLQTHHESVLGKLPQFNHKTKRLSKAICAVFFVAHVMGCVWASLVFCDAEGSPSWFDYLSHVNPDNKLYSTGTPVRVYMCALYWAVFTLTGIGYGDIVPFSNLEYAVAIPSMLAASLTWAWVIANFVSIVGSMQQTVNDHLHTLDYVNQLLRDNSAQADLGRRLREYFTKMKGITRQDSVNELIDELSPELRIEVVYAVHGDWIDKIWWMKRLLPGSEFMVELTQNMKATLHAPSEVIPKRPELVVIRRGLCIRGGRLMTSGNVYGEDFLLNNEALRMPHITLVLTFLHVLVMPKSVFETVLLHHPEVAPAVRKVFVTYAMIRGIHRLAGAHRKARQRMGSAAFDSELLESQDWASSQAEYQSQEALQGSPRTRNRVSRGSTLRNQTSAQRGATVAPVLRVMTANSRRRVTPPPDFFECREELEAEVEALAEQAGQVEGRVTSRLKVLEQLADTLVAQAALLSGAARHGGMGAGAHD